MSNKFDQNKYIQQYHKEHYSRFLVDLPKEVKQELDDLLKKNGITKAQFLRWAIEQFKKTNK